MRYSKSGRGVMGTPTGVAYQTLSAGLINTFFEGRVRTAPHALRVSHSIQADTSCLRLTCASCS